MKKYFAAAALLMMMAACGSAGQDKKLEGTTWKLARMEAIPAAAVGKEADVFTLGVQRRRYDGRRAYELQPFLRQV